MKRRTFVGAAAASLPALSILTAGGARAQSKEIRMIESGGLSGDSIQVGYIDPLKTKTGINVIRESPSSLGKLRALVESGQTSATMFELGSGVVLQAKKLGLIEPIDWAAVAPAAMFPEAKAEYGFGYQYFSTIMAWRAGAKEPKNFTEFFDIKAFPGKRCLPDYPPARNVSACRGEPKSKRSGHNVHSRSLECARARPSVPAHLRGRKGA